MRALTLTLFAVLGLPADAVTQFSSDFPGVPRAAITHFGTVQGRFDLDFTGMRFTAADDPDRALDSTSVSIRIGFGRSWHVAPNLEVGFDISLAEGRLLHLAADGDFADDLENNLAATVGYGLRLGVKFRPLAYVDPDGYGVSAAVGFAIQPSLQPALTYSGEGDSSVLGGAVVSGDDDDDSPPVRLHAGMQFLGAVSYRAPRAELDVGVVRESADHTGAFRSPVPVYQGTSVRVGARFRVTPSIALGAAYWGSGAPPWRDQVNPGVRDLEHAPFGLVIGLGSQREKGTELMLSSPTGNFTESLSFHLRVR
jgi:hypothetical protein